MFPKIPADLSSATRDELNGYADELRAAAQKVTENAADPTAHAEIFESMEDSQVIAAMTAGAEDMERVRTALSEIEAGEAEYVEAVAAAAETFGLTADADEADEAPEDVPAAEAVAEVIAEAETATEAAAEVPAEVETPAAEAVEAPAEVVAEPVVAAAPARVQLRRPRPVTPTADFQPIEVGTAGPALVASAGIQGVDEGKPLSREEFGAAMIEKRRRMVSTARGVREEVIVASVKYPTDKNRWLEPTDIEGNAHKIKAAVDADRQMASDPDALMASGGLCAPLTPYYDLAQVAVASRPVRDSLIGFDAARGGVIVGTPATIADIDTAITVVTAANDAAGGSLATKGCQRIECPPFTEVEVDIIARCLEIGNLTGRTYPELVAQWTELVMAAHARTAEGLMLDAIKGYSTEVSWGAQYGALSTVLGGLLTAGAGMRSRHRMDPRARFQVWLPTWTAPLLVNDLENSQFDRFSYDLEGVIGLLRSRGVDPVFYLDEAEGTDQIYAAQTAGALLPFPTTLELGFAPRGSYMFVDGGTLDLGLVRDSVLNSTNDYQIFAETFENVAFIGVESLWISMTVCPDGTVAAPDTAITCS